MVIIIILLAIIIKILNGLLHTFSFWQNFLFTTEQQQRKNKNELKEESSRKRTANISTHFSLFYFYIFRNTCFSDLTVTCDLWPMTRCDSLRLGKILDFVWLDVHVFSVSLVMAWDSTLENLVLLTRSKWECQITCLWCSNVLVWTSHF